ncbi:MAG TPA: hypothetical protein VN512_04320, partial [Clostridia bacterium]|nr:hypothetical protein [Clostridia bacterium]
SYEKSRYTEEQIVFALKPCLIKRAGLLCTISLYYRNTKLRERYIEAGGNRESKSAKKAATVRVSPSYAEIGKDNTNIR